MKPTQSQISTYMDVVQAIADAIRELGSAPSGHLYASVMGVIGLETYEHIIDLLVSAEFVRRDSDHLLVWVGKTKEGE